SKLSTLVFLFVAAGALAFALDASAETLSKPGVIAGRIVEGDTLAPVDGATLILTDATGGAVVVSSHTDGNGRFRLVAPPGTYDILAIFGDAKWLHRGIVLKEQEHIEIPGCLAVDPEVVTVHEKAPTVAPSKAPEVKSASVKKLLPYSDEAILSDLWTAAWL